MSARCCFCVVGWHFHGPFYDQLCQLPGDKYIVSHRSPDFVARQDLAGAIRKHLYFRPNRGRDWGAYRQFHEIGGLPEYDFVIHCHDDLVFRDPGIVDEIGRQFQDPETGLVTLRGRRKADFRFGKYKDELPYEDDEDLLVRTVSASFFAARPVVSSLIGRLPAARMPESRKEGKTAARNFAYLVTRRFGIDSVVHLDRDRWFETSVLADFSTLGHVVLVTGPTSSGKTTLAQELLEDRVPELNAELGVESFRGWVSSSAFRIDKHVVPAADRVVLHYDFLRPLKEKARSHRDDPALRLLDRAETLSIVTVWTPPDRLRRQFQQSEMQSPRRSAGQDRVLEAYRSDEEILACYRRWFDFCAARFPRAAQHIVECGPRFHSMDRQEWEQRARPRVFGRPAGA